MIKAQLSKKGKAFSLELEGHSYNAPTGHDLICAAVSTLVFALDSYLDKLDGEGLLIKRQESVLGKGLAELGALPDIQSRDKLDGALEMIYCYLSLLQENYPENIEFTDNFNRKRRNNHG